MLWLGCLYFFAVATTNWAEVMGETRGRGGAAPNDLTWLEKNCGGGGGKKKERGRFIIIVSDVSHSNTAHIKVGKEEREGRKQREGERRRQEQEE